MSTPIADHTAYVSQMAAQLDITLSPEDMAKVSGTFANLARVAGLLRDNELDEMTTSAAVFTPFEGHQP
jgi:Protein of unknown function (DUF4089)